MSGFTYPEPLTVRIEQCLARGWSVKAIMRHLSCTYSQVQAAKAGLRSVNAEVDAPKKRRAS